MKLCDLLCDIEYTVLDGSDETDVSALVYQSENVKKGCVFVCISGAVHDGHDYIPQALEAGAAAVVAEREDTELPCAGGRREGQPQSGPEGERVTYIRVGSSRAALAHMSAAWFGYPAERLRTIGITGTKGKTTTAYMIRAILEAAGIKTGLIGTIESVIGNEHFPAVNTTPESYCVQEMFRRMVDRGISAVVMEVSSQALKLSRVDGVTFDVGVFTNLEEDHIGEHEHESFEDYLFCKSLLFQRCRLGVINGDSRYAPLILRGHKCAVDTFGTKASNDFVAERIRLEREQGALGVAYHVGGRMDLDVRVRVPGEFSVYNSLAAVAVCRHFGVAPEVMGQALAAVTVRGRIEIVPQIKRYTMIIDYAHNAMALEKLLTTLRAYGPRRILCLFGCGGNRAKARRYEMGAVSARLADLTVVTSDNPRNEEPQAIMEDILSGVKKEGGKHIAIPDRKKAIARCMEIAKDNDIVVLAGKGHENYQEIRGIKYHMDERELIGEILAENPRLLH